MPLSLPLWRRVKIYFRFRHCSLYKSDVAGIALFLTVDDFTWKPSIRHLIPSCWVGWRQRFCNAGWKSPRYGRCFPYLRWLRPNWWRKPVPVVMKLLFGADLAQQFWQNIVPFRVHFLLSVFIVGGDFDLLDICILRDVCARHSFTVQPCIVFFCLKSFILTSPVDRRDFSYS